LASFTMSVQLLAMFVSKVVVDRKPRRLRA